MLPLSAMTEGRNVLNLQQIAEDFANQQWVPAHMTPEDATDFVLDQFRRTVESELQMIEITTRN